jgi:uncharacterized membrane protein
MNSTTINHNYYKWNISSGDYYRDYESTEQYAKKLAMKKKIKKLTKIFITMGISYSILTLSVSYFL